MSVIDVSLNYTSLWWRLWIKKFIKNYGTKKWEEKCRRSLNSELEKYGAKKATTQEGGEKEIDGANDDKCIGDDKKVDGNVYDPQRHAAMCCVSGDLDMLVYLLREKDVRLFLDLFNVW
jgi:hypothetical protein